MFLLACLFFVSTTALASFHKHIWPQWQAHNPLSQAVISHQKWQDFLSKYLYTNDEGINLVDYPHLTKNDLALLNAYIKHLSKININEYNRNEQLAFWLNLYNALIVQLIADYYPVDTVQDVNISPGLFSVGPWGANLVTIGGTQLTLDDIQNRIIRAIWNDPRTLYAINDGCIGAPNLRKQVYQGATINEQLNQATRDYINSMRGLQIIEGKLILSKMYEWYLDDFGGRESDIVHHLTYFANKPLHDDLRKIDSINSYTYNWHLNSTVATS